MKIRNMLVVALCLLAVAQAGAQKKVRIFIAGDSTAQTYDPEKTLMRGWGQELHLFLNDSVEIINRSIGGRSSESFIREGRWDKITEELSPGDWVFIQFGHNDTSTNPQRHATPEQYKANLARFCTEARSKGANPVILTSIVMREWQDGKLVAKRPHFAEYVQYARDVAAQTSTPLIDMNKMTAELVTSLGDEGSRELYYWVKVGDHPALTRDASDDTHLREKGAAAYAGLVIKGLKELNLPLSAYTK